MGGQQAFEKHLALADNTFKSSIVVSLCVVDQRGVQNDVFTDMTQQPLLTPLLHVSFFYFIRTFKSIYVSKEMVSH